MGETAKIRVKHIIGLRLWEKIKMAKVVKTTTFIISLQTNKYRVYGIVNRYHDKANHIQSYRNKR